MRELIDTLIDRLALAYIWVRRILLAPQHFKVPVWTRVKISLRGFIPDQYEIYDLRHNDPKEYLSEFDWYRSRRINGKYAFVLNNKVVFEQLVSQYARTPKTMCMSLRGRIIDNDGRYIDNGGLMDMLKKQGISIYKPIDAGKGKRVRVIDMRTADIIVNGKPLERDALLKLLHGQSGWFISEYVNQADYLNALFPHSTNTLRMITVRDDETNTAQLLFAVQRIGRSSTIPVDNASQGGLVAKVELDSGVISEAKSLHDLGVYPIHPDTGMPIKGEVIPNWEALKQSITELANRFSYLNFIAWDVLVSENGELYIIEANASSGVNIIQLWGGQRKHELGDVYRKYKIIR